MLLICVLKWKSLKLSFFSRWTSQRYRDKVDQNDNRHCWLNWSALQTVSWLLSVQLKEWQQQTAELADVSCRQTQAELSRSMLHPISTAENCEVLLCIAAVDNSDQEIHAADPAAITCTTCQPCQLPCLTTPWLVLPASFAGKQSKCISRLQFIKTANTDGQWLWLNFLCLLVFILLCCFNLMFWLYAVNVADKMLCCLFRKHYVFGICACCNHSEYLTKTVHSSNVTTWKYKKSVTENK